MRKSLLALPLLAAVAVAVAGPAFAATSTVTEANLGVHWSTGDTRPGCPSIFRTRRRIRIRWAVDAPDSRHTPGHDRGNHHSRLRDDVDRLLLWFPAPESSPKR